MKRSATMCSVVLFISLFLVANTAYPQFKLSLGPTTGLNFNLHTGSDLSETGTGFGFVFAGQLDMSFSKTVGLITDIAFYDNRSGSSTTTSSNQYGNISSTVSNDVSASLAYFMIEPLFKLNMPASGLYFVVGPSIGFNIEGSSEVTTTETLPQGYIFTETGTNKYEVKNKASLKDLLARFELKLGAGYDIPLTRDISLAPQVTFGYGITKVMSDVSWRVLTIQALCGVKFRLI